MDTTALANLLFPDITKTIGDYETIYPPRDLPEGAVVTRIAPSPTGFVHLGNLYNAIGERLAHQTGGVFYLRIEDTDQKREVEGAVEAVIDAMTFYGVHFDEGATADGETGAYGPYRQRQRKELYQTVAKSLVLRGLAYPCFCTEDDLKAMHEQQEAAKENYGYYGKYALWRDRSIDDIKAELDKGTEWVLRFRSEGDPAHTVEVQDGIRGTLKLQENYTDFVLLKSDGIPTYHFAHVCDDHFMRTTHVIRDESWLATLPIHVQLFDTLGWARPVYCHTATLMKMDGSSKRKLSKRKDPELALSFYREAGFPQEATWLYLLTVLNSNFEEWHLANPDADSRAFTFSLEKMSTSGALFDLEKLDNICREYLSRQSADTVYDGLLAWAKQFDPALAARMTEKAALYKSAIGVGRGGDKYLYNHGQLSGECRRRNAAGDPDGLSRFAQLCRYTGGMVRKGQGADGAARLCRPAEEIQEESGALQGQHRRCDESDPRGADRPAECAGYLRDQPCTGRGGNTPPARSLYARISNGKGTHTL